MVVYSKVAHDRTGRIYYTVSGSEPATCLELMAYDLLDVPYRARPKFKILSPQLDP